MNDESLPSGPWIGFYVYSRRRGERHRMDMTLTFANGVLQGEGSDDIGKFLIRGKYEPKEAWWTKTYVGRHSVHYRGFRDGFKKALWGTWELSPKITGGFKIWPLGSADGEDDVETKSEEKPIEAVGDLVAVEDGKTSEGHYGYPNLKAHAAMLLIENRILDAMRVLDIGTRVINPHLVAPVLMGYLLDHCSNRAQLSQVSWLLDEIVSLPPVMEGPLRMKEHRMYTKFHDASGVEKCVRRLAALDSVE